MVSTTWLVMMAATKAMLAASQVIGSASASEDATSATTRQPGRLSNIFLSFWLSLIALPAMRPKNRIE